MLRPYLHLSNINIQDIFKWLSDSGIKVFMKNTENPTIHVKGFGKSDITLTKLKCGIFSILTPLGSSCYIDHISHSKGHLNFYYRDYPQFSTDRFNV